MVDKVDSNSTGLRIAEEVSLKKLPVQPTWLALEPESYSDFGGEITTVTRNPINDSRQRRKGTATGINASGGISQDLTLGNMTRLMRGFMFADAREKANTASVNTIDASRIDITAVTASNDTYSAAALPTFKVGDLVLARGFGPVANNGLKTVVSSAPGALGVLEPLVDEANPPVDAELHTVGHQFADNAASLTLNGGLVRMAVAAVNLTTLGVIPGEWIFVGGDDPADRFSNTSFGMARIGVVTADYIEFDKVDWEPQAETGAGKGVRIFYGIMIKNELKALIKRTSYSIERTLGEDDDGEMAEYLDGAVPNELTFDMPTEDKITMDMSFMALDAVQHTGQQGLRAGLRPDLIEEDCLNTSKDFSRIKLALVSKTDANPIALAAFLQNVNLTINNNASVNKALGVFGGMGVTVGNFEVDGSADAYFNGMAATKAVRDNSDATLDIVIVKNNAGLLFDLPLISLGNGKLTVEADEPIILPVDTAAARGKFGNTLTFQQFRYLPDIAATGV